MAQTARHEAEKAEDTAKHASNGTADASKNVTNKAAEAAKEVTGKSADAAKDAAGKGAEMIKEVTTKTAELSRGMMDASARTVTAFRNDLQKRAGAAAEVQNQTVRKSTEGVAEFSKLYTDLLKEQTEYNLQAVQAFGKLFNWNEAIRVQSEFMRISFERVAQLNNRYAEIVQGVMKTATDSAKEQAKKTA